ncbi:MAG: hypothetical protein R3B09_00150 [Nannocystaceae bacterium]
MRSTLADALAGTHYVQLTLRGGDVYTGFVLELGDDLVVLASVEDLTVDGYELIRLAAVEQVRRSAVDEHFEALIRRSGQGVLADPELGPLTSMSAALGRVRDRWPLVGIECGAEELDDDWSYLVAALVSADDLRVHARYVTTTGHWRELDVVTTRSITRVTFGSRYLSLFAERARPWTNVPWRGALSDEEARRWGPLSGLLEALGRPIEGLELRRLRVSFDLQRDRDDPSRHRGRWWGVEVIEEADRVAAILLQAQADDALEEFRAPFVEGLAVSCSQEEVREALGPAVAEETTPAGEPSDRYAFGPVVARFVYDESGGLRRLELEHVEH